MTRHTTDAILRLVAIVLMLAGVVMIFAASSSGLAIAIITVGIAIVAIQQIGNVCRSEGQSDHGVGRGGHAHS